MRLMASMVAVMLCLSTVACGESDSLEEREQLIEALYGSVELTNDSVNDINFATTSNFTIPYCRPDPNDASTTLNPYLCKSTLNATVSDLLYDQLITVNSQYEAEFVIARSIEQTSAKVITVYLRDGIVFSDGSVLTGEDIKYSFAAAKAEGSRYAAQLEHFVNCMYTENTISFRLDVNDPMSYMLLDFPIIKKGSDADGAVPIGSGRYYYYSDPERGTYLLRNPKWYNNSGDYDIQRISLISMPTIESIVHSIEIGTVSYFYTDLRDGYPSRINAYYSPVNLNNLIYIGIDTSDTRLRDYRIRKAISDAINREVIITNAFAGRAYAATGPLPTAWAPAASAQSGSTLSNTASAQQLLDDAGYINMDENYVRNNGSGQILSYYLLVNRDNAQHVTTAEAIAGQLKEVGINIIVNAVAADTYRERLASGQYDLYLGEYAMFNNMDFSDLFTQNNGIYYGLAPEMTASAWNSYLEGTTDITGVIEAFESEYPFVAVCYRLGMVYYSRSIDAHMDITESDFFYGMDMWDVALATGDD